LYSILWKWVENLMMVTVIPKNVMKCNRKGRRDLRRPRIRYDEVEIGC